MKIPNVTIQQLLEAGVHLGHKTLRNVDRKSINILRNKEISLNID